MRRLARAKKGLGALALLFMISCAASAAQTIVSLTFDDGFSDAPTAAQILNQHSMKGTFYIISGVLGTPDYMTLAQVKAIQASGHEIGGHTITHPHLSTLTAAQQQQEICGGRTQLINDGFPAPVSFAYPYGDSTSATEMIVSSCGFTSGRGAWNLDCTYSNCANAETIPPEDPYWVRTPDAVVYTTTLAQIEQYVTNAESSGGGWVPLQFHHVCDGCDGTDANGYSVSSGTLSAFLTWLQPRSSQGTVVKTVGQIMSVTPPTNSSATIFNNTAATDGWKDPSPIEVGVKFRSDVSGFITGLRFYKGSFNTSAHIGHLWTSTGVLLASATYTGETASGWQQVTLASPVAITANTTYVASYFSTTGYSVNAPYFTAAVDNPPLHALQNGTDGPNGLYIYSAASAFPNQSYNSSNYWVDVIFASTGTVTPPPNPVPSLASLSPSSATVHGSSFTLTLNGSNFISSSTVKWNGSTRATTFVNSGKLTAAISAVDIASTGTVSVTVFNPTPGGGTSSAQTFTINAQPPPPNPIPALTSVSPSSATTGGTAFTLTLTGTNFISSSTVRWNGSSRTTTYVSTVTLTAAIPASDIVSSGTASITVFNPTPGGGASGAQVFTINAGPPPPPNPVPTLISLSPSSATSGGSAFTLTVTGTNFITGSVVKWNGSSRATSFISNTTLSAMIAAADIATAGSASVTVFTSTPGGGTSGSVSFTINASTVSGGGPWTIWGSSAPPAGDGWKDPSALEVGVRFRSDITGYITGIRFYKWSTNTGTHMGHLWTNSGTLLASVTFTGETASGWQTMYFSTPVAVNANTTYVASYFTTTGYAVSVNYFAAAVNNAPLHALQSGVDGLNGVYLYGATSVFPTQSTKTSNYWVDVVFNTSPSHSMGTLSNIPPTPGGIGAATFTDLNQVREYPNPWRADRPNNGFITFDQLPLGSTVKIFTVSAHWVRTLDASGGSVHWDLKNDSGDPVASGFYIYLITSPSGNIHGTFAVIR